MRFIWRFLLIAAIVGSELVAAQVFGFLPVLASAIIVLTGMVGILLVKREKVNYCGGNESSVLERKFAYALFGAACSSIILVILISLLETVSVVPYADPFFLLSVLLALLLGAALGMLLGANRGYKLPRW